METIIGVPAIFKILILFSGIVTIYRLKAPLWVALLITSGAAGLWFGAGPARTLSLAAKSVLEQETLFLCGIVVLILGFSNIMQATGVLDRMVGAFNALIGKSIYSGASLAALIGLLPMPGGAVFSAPMVESACGDELSAERKAAINYWFRHLWEYWWPLYPGVILASHLFGASTFKFIIFNIPLMLASIAGGYFFILRPALSREKGKESGTETSSVSVRRAPGLLVKALRESACIGVVIVTIFSVGPALEYAKASGVIEISDLAAKYWPVILGVVLGAVQLVVAHGLSARAALRALFSKNQLSMLMLVIGIMVFRDTLSGVGAFSAAKVDLDVYHVPPIAVIAVLPFISGLVMGLAVAFVGASFPLVISLLPPDAVGSDVRFAYLALAYSFGYVGMILSPVHFCLIVTKDFFEADLIGIYRIIAPATVVVLAAGGALFFLYRAIL